MLEALYKTMMQHAMGDKQVDPLLPQMTNRKIALITLLN